MELDFSTVKALSSPTRIEILKRLLEKDSTPTRLSDDIDRSKSTVSSHLGKLEKADLVEKDEEEGRKRVMYRPTRKAENIVRGRERKVKFSIASSAVTGLAGLALVGANFSTLTGKYASRGSEVQLSAATADAAREAAAGGMNFMSPDVFLGAGLFLLSLSLGTMLYGLLIRRLTGS